MNDRNTIRFCPKLLGARNDRACCRPAKQRDELAAPQLIELHPVTVGLGTIDDNRFHDERMLAVLQDESCLLHLGIGFAFSSRYQSSAPSPRKSVFL